MIFGIEIVSENLIIIALPASVTIRLLLVALFSVQECLYNFWLFLRSLYRQRRDPLRRLTGTQRAPRRRKGRQEIIIVLAKDQIRFSTAIEILLEPDS